MGWQTLRPAIWLWVAVAATVLAGCVGGSPPGVGLRQLSTKECLVRAMYFESNRSSQEGMLAVGTVVMNRVESGRYPRSVCGVVGQRNQFAQGVLWKRMSRRDLALVEPVADAVLRGQRHPGVGSAMFFHAAGRRYPYKNMHYVLVAGGNAFYEKRRPGRPQRAVDPGFTATAAVDAADRDRLALFLKTGRGLY